MHAHSTESTVAVFHVVASETWIDISHSSEKSTETHWVSESGILDTFLLPGPTTEDVFKNVHALLVPLFCQPIGALDITSADGTMSARTTYAPSRSDSTRMICPLTFSGLISNTLMTFMWKDKTFPDPVKMINDVAVTGRKVCNSS